MRNLKSSLVVTSLGMLLALALLPACETWERGNSERSAGRKVDDHHITRVVKSELRHEPIYKFKDVGVKTFDGVVQLSGFVTTEDQKRRAGELAQSTAGVTQVINNISLKAQALTPTGILAPTGATNNASR